MRAMEWVLAIGAATTGICWGQNPAPLPATGCSTDALRLLQPLWTELRALRVELLEDRRATQQAKLQDLEKQLGAVLEQQRELELEQSSRVNQMAEIETQLQQPNLEKNEREELESQMTQLRSVPPGPSPAVQNVLSQREARVRGLLAEQEQRVNAIEQLARQLTTGAR